MSCQMAWIKLATSTFDDDKIMVIESLPEGDSIIAIWFKLLCLAGKQNNDGVFLINGRIPYTDEMFATILHRPIDTIRLAIKTFTEFGMIDVINNTVTIPNWGAYQGSEKLDAAKESIRKRVEKHRTKQRAMAEGTVNSVTCNVTDPVTVTPDVTLQSVTCNVTDPVTCNAPCNVTVTRCNADRIRIRNKNIDDDVGGNLMLDNACARAREDDEEETSTTNTTDDLALYFQKAFINLTAGNWEMLRQVCEEGGFDGTIICYAIDCTVAIASNRFSTVLKILSSWAANGVHTVDDAKRFEEQRRYNANIRQQQQQRNAYTETSRSSATTPEFY